MNHPAPFLARAARVVAALITATAATVTLAGRPASASDDGTPMLTIEVSGCDLSFVLGPSLPDDAVLVGNIEDGPSFKQPASPGTTVTFTAGQDFDATHAYADPLWVEVGLNGDSTTLAFEAAYVDFPACAAIWPGTTVLHLSAVASGEPTVDSVDVTVRIGDGSGCGSPRGVVATATVPLTGVIVDLPVAAYFLCVFVDEVPGAESITVDASPYVDRIEQDGGNVTRTITVAFPAPPTTDAPDSTAPDSTAPPASDQQVETPTPEPADVDEGTLPPAADFPAGEPPAFEPAPTAELPATGTNTTLAVVALATTAIGAGFVLVSRRGGHPTPR